MFTTLLNNPFLDGLVKVIKSLEGNLVEACDIIGDVKASNVSIANTAFANLFPPGNYRALFRSYDEFDKNIFNLTVHSTSFYVKQEKQNK